MIWMKPIEDVTFPALLFTLLLLFAWCDSSCFLESHQLCTFLAGFTMYKERVLEKYPVLPEIIFLLIVVACVRVWLGLCMPIRVMKYLPPQHRRATQFSLWKTGTSGERDRWAAPVDDFVLVLPCLSEGATAVIPPFWHGVGKMHEAAHDLPRSIPRTVPAVSCQSVWKKNEQKSASTIISSQQDKQELYLMGSRGNYRGGGLCACIIVKWTVKWLFFNVKHKMAGMSLCNWIVLNFSSSFRHYKKF